MDSVDDYGAAGSAERYSCHVTGIHHFNKAGQYRGSTAIKGIVDWLVNVTRTGKIMKFKHEKVRDAEGVNFSALTNWTGYAFNLSPVTTKETSTTEATPNDIYNRLARIARENPGISQTRLANKCRDETGMGINRIRGHIKDAINNDYLAMEKDGDTCRHYAE